MDHVILIVDDDKLVVDTLKKRFDNWGMIVYTANTAVEAKSVLDKVTPEVVILDLILENDESSQNILNYMKSQDRLREIPILVLTNLDQPEMKNLLLSQGVKEYIVKGTLTLDQIYDKVMSYLEPKNQAG